MIPTFFLFQKRKSIFSPNEKQVSSFQVGMDAREKYGPYLFLLK